MAHVYQNHNSTVQSISQSHYTITTPYRLLTKEPVHLPTPKERQPSGSVLWQITCNCVRYITLCICTHNRHDFGKANINCQISQYRLCVTVTQLPVLKKTQIREYKNGTGLVFPACHTFVSSECFPSTLNTHTKNTINPISSFHDDLTPNSYIVCNHGKSHIYFAFRTNFCRNELLNPLSDGVHYVTQKLRKHQISREYLYRSLQISVSLLLPSPEDGERKKKKGGGGGGNYTNFDRHTNTVWGKRWARAFTEHKPKRCFWM